MIYLDSAATSLYKPETVQTAVLEALNTMTSPGRGGHEAALRASECCYSCREALAELFHVPSPEQVVFTFNATHALNIAIRSLVEKGTRVLISGYEHNSVTRPLYSIGADVRILDTPLFDRDAFLNLAREQIRWADVVVCTHVSNVFGYILPLEEFAQMCRETGVPLIVDASQSAGILDFNFAALGAAFAAMPGHKGLMGPQGTGVLLCKNDAKPLLYGGSGSASLLPGMPEFLPDRLEAGTHNVTGIAGLLASVRYLQNIGCAEVRRKERALLERFMEGLHGCEGLRTFFTDDPDAQCGVLSAVQERMDCERFAEVLERNGVAVRSGLHCAPTAHRTVGTLEHGTVRFSFSPFNTAAQVDRAAEICKNIMKNS